ncbi:phosphoserine phosphatase SerB [Kibdelosporangium philippinense]|uniref:phosphoserine phosphatase n=1 Tax=Kibdelosporangium philippinense TaxID=211113 RepID=A0ABS8Z2Z4_9PSEU|nr:phosphoserine phosphatase SerB [Kibdelosporangium philippinense]MCE7002314.1 phosphoserine phosphatase SerB [Kibdelosporangium philippinense]
MAAPAPLTWRETDWVDPTPGSASHVITVVGRAIRTEVLGAVLHRASVASTVVSGTRTMASYPCTAVELSVQLARPFDTVEPSLRAELREISGNCGVDITLQRTDRQYGLVVFDMDSTLVKDETIVRIAERAGRSREVNLITSQAMRGELDFAASLRLRAGALAGLPAAVLDEVAQQSELMPGALVTVRSLQSMGIRVGVISGGFEPIVARIARQLRLDFHAANHLEVASGTLTGRLTGDIVDADAKAVALRRFAARERIALSRCVAVGDGANDIPMLKAAGLGVAFHAKPAVVAAADVSISFQRLDLVLPLLGIPVPCAVVDTYRVS